MRYFTLLAATAALSLSGTAMAKHHGDHMKADNNHNFGSYDSNNDGMITQQEFMAHRMQMVEQNAAKHFAKMDANGDGMITMEEAQGNAKKRWNKRKDKMENSDYGSDY